MPISRLAFLHLAFAGFLAHSAVDARAQVAPSRADSGTAILEGIVLDSLHDTPLGGAAIQIGTLKRRITTDAEGHFLATGLPAGPQQVTFRHPVLDSLGTRSAAVSVTLEPGDTTRIDLALPSGRTLLARLCPAPTADQRADRVAGVLGVVRDAETDNPVPKAAVRLQWRTVVYDKKLGVRRQIEFRDAVADSTGLYVVCNAPAEIAGTLEAAAAGYDTASAEVALPRAGAAVMHLQLPSPKAVATLNGTVRDAQGAALQSAEVSIVSRPGATPPIARTDSRGAFTLQGPIGGTRVIEVKRVGFQPLHRTVSLMPGRTTTLTFALTAAAVQLPEVAARAKTTAELNGFPDRLKRGGGQFYTRDQIARKQILLSADLVREMPGMQVQQTGANWVITNQSLRQNISGRTCPISTFLDGVLTPAELVLNVPASDIDGVEIYNIPDNVPSEYAGPNSQCGAILVWTTWRNRK